MKTLKNGLSVLIAMFFVAVSASPLMADKYPTDIITWNFAMKPGGGQDGATRLLAKLVTDILGQKIIVKNRAGAGGAVAATFVKNVRPNGYQLGVGFSTTMAFDPWIKKLQFKADDFRYITTFALLNVGYLSVDDGRWSDFQGMINWAKSTGKPLNYGSNTLPDRLIARHIAGKENITINIIPMKGGGPGKAALMGGHVDFGILGSSHFATAAANKLQIINVLNATRVDGYSDVPTLVDLGYGVSVDYWTTLYGPKGLSDEIVNTLASAVKQAANSKQFKDLVENKLGARMIVLGPDELTNRMNTWSKNYKQLVDSMN